MICPMCGSDNRGSTRTCRSCGASLAEPTTGGIASQTLPPGTKLQTGTYTIGKVLGQGGFGITYQGGEPALRRAVAIKEFFPQGCMRQRTTVQPTGSVTADDYLSGLIRFLDEARVLAKFEHPNIVRVHACFEENSTAYMVMELLDGSSLGSLLQKHKRLPEQEAVSYIRAAGEGLAAVHSANLLHRDIKPDNVMIRKDGQAVLVDFGSAREFTAGKTRRMTAVLTPGYAPLEQYGQQARFGVFTDIYALGATLYHLLTGQLPVQSTDRAAGVELDPPSRLDRKITSSVSAAVMWAMEMKATERPQSVADFLDALGGVKPVPHPTRGGGAGGASQESTPALSNPYERRIAQIAAELSRPLPRPPKVPHDARIKDIEDKLVHLAVSLPEDLKCCPGCQAAQMTEPTGKVTGLCPLCRARKLVICSIDMELCPVCRKGHLAADPAEAEGLLCPVCRSAWMETERRRRLGILPDLWMVCPQCHAEIDVVSDERGILVRFTDDPHGTGAGYAGMTLPIAEWRALSGRETAQLSCNVCAAQFEPTDTNHLKLVAVGKDPHGVGAYQLGQTRSRMVWARMARRLPLGEGNLYCPGCGVEFDYRKEGGARTLRVLDAGRNPNHWQANWFGKPWPIEEWYLATEGKKSLRPGLLCPSCKTEFDSEKGKHKLVATSQANLQARCGEVHSLTDWHRIARVLPLAREEERLETDLAELRLQREQAEATWLETQRKEREAADEELTDLLRRSLLEGYVAPPLDVRPQMRKGERILLSVEGRKEKVRVSQGNPYLDADAERGSLCISDRRIVFAGDQGSVWQKPLDALRGAELQGELLVLSFFDLKKPVCFTLPATHVPVTVAGVTRLVGVTTKHILTLLTPLMP